MDRRQHCDYCGRSFTSEDNPCSYCALERVRAVESAWPGMRVVECSAGAGVLTREEIERRMHVDKLEPSEPDLCWVGSYLCSLVSDDETYRPTVGPDERAALERVGRWLVARGMSR